MIWAMIFVVGITGMVAAISDDPWIAPLLGWVAVLASEGHVLALAFTIPATFVWLVGSCVMIEVDRDRGLDPTSYMIARAIGKDANRFDRAAARRKLEGQQ